MPSVYKGDKLMILERIKKPIGNNMNITKGSTPIIYFGDYDNAKACTVSINPSDREFLDKNGKILTNNEERLCSRIKLGRKDTDELTDSDAETVLKYCKNYFKTRPYKTWFNKYDYLINKFGYSYFNDTCVHLDLVQWATTPFWNKVSDRNKSLHLKNDIPVLEYLLNKQFDVIFLNGSTVVTNICRYLNSMDLNEKETFFKNKNGNTCKIKVYTGKYKSIKVIGWSTYLQSQSIGGYDNIDVLYDTIKNTI